MKWDFSSHNLGCEHMKKEFDNWQPISGIAARVVAELEEKQRKAFERVCERDGIKKAERANVDA